MRGPSYSACDNKEFELPVAVGTRFGSYEILSAIGAGGMGEVYRPNWKPGK